MIGSPLTTMPSGWFRIAYSADLRPQQVHVLQYFGQHFALLRTASGQLYLLDTPDAPLATGHCSSNAIQALVDKANTHLHAWPVQEVNGVIFVYYHPLRQQPEWHMPTLPEYDCTDWIAFHHRRWQVKTSPQEVAENGMDIAHSPLVHPQTFTALKSETVTIEGITLVHKLLPSYYLSVGIGPGLTLPGSLEITYYGLGAQVSRAVIAGGLNLNFLAIFLLTPVNHQQLEIDLVFSMKKVWSKALTQLLAPSILMAKVGRDLEQDIPIWEHKIYHPHPTLCSGDGPIMKYRQWCQQFYLEA